MVRAILLCWPGLNGKCRSILQPLVRVVNLIKIIINEKYPKSEVVSTTRVQRFQKNTSDVVDLIFKRFKRIL